jgi:hypothetical protein
MGYVVGILADANGILSGILIPLAILALTRAILAAWLSWQAMKRFDWLTEAEIGQWPLKVVLRGRPRPPPEGG